MEQYISKSALVAEIDKRKNLCEKIVLDLRTQENKDYYQGKVEAYSEITELIDTLEVKEVEKIPATIELNRYGNRFISTWSGLCQYNDFVIGEEITILLPKRFKAQKGKEV